MSQNAGKRVIIITFFSLCGGTASTLCIHGAYIQRNVAKQLGCDATHIGVMILPVLYVKEYVQEQLGLKGLANLDALSLESKFAFKYSPSLHVDIEAPPFDFMIALDGSSATGANLTTITAVKKAASALMTEFVEWEHSVFFERFVDVRDVTYSTIFEKPRRFVLFGIAKLVYKPESLIKDFGIMLGKDVLGKISAKKTDLCEITADLNRFGLEDEEDELQNNELDAELDDTDVFEQTDAFSDDLTLEERIAQEGMPEDMAYDPMEQMDEMDPEKLMKDLFFHDPFLM